MGHLLRPQKVLLYHYVDEFLARPKRYHTALDLGCGDMQFAPKVPASRYIGVDVNAERLAKAAARYPQAVAIASSIEDVDVSVKGDLVLCLQCIGMNNLFKAERGVSVVRKIVAATEPCGDLVFNAELDAEKMKEIDRLARDAFSRVRHIRYGRFSKERAPGAAHLLARLMRFIPPLAISGSRRVGLYLCEARKPA